MKPAIERISESCILSEAPYWDAETETLYYVDIFGHNIHRYVPSKNIHAKANVGKQLSFIIPVQGTIDRFIAGMGRDLNCLTWDGVSSEVSKSERILEVDNRSDLNTNLFNDGKTDATGRLWAGTMGNNIMQDKAKKGTLYSIGPNKLIHNHFSNIHISNGLCFSPDNKKFYFIDSGENRVDQFDFDIATGTITNRQPLFTLDKHNIEGFPDGQTVDTDGNLWVAVFNGSKVLKIDTKKPETLLATIEMPVKQITCAVFGGSNMDELYVTTARFPMGDETLEPPDNGAVYRVTGLGAKGFPGVKFRL